MAGEETTQAGVDGTEHERKRDYNEQRFTFGAMEKPMSAITITRPGDRPATDHESSCRGQQ